MFQRFNDGARRVVVHAQEEARLLNHNYIGTEHILLGIARDDEGIAVEALDALDLRLAAIRRQVEQIIGRGAMPPSGHIPFTPRAKKVLELSLREALQLGSNFIGAEHILLGLLREGDGVAAMALVQLGADLNRVRHQVIRVIAQYEGRPAAPESETRLGGAGSGLSGGAPMVRGRGSGWRGARSGSWEADVMPVLADIQRRLAAIEKHLGIADPPPQPGPDTAAPG